MKRIFLGFVVVITSSLFIINCGGSSSASKPGYTPPFDKIPDSLAHTSNDPDTQLLIAAQDGKLDEVISILEKGPLGTLLLSTRVNYQDKDQGLCALALAARGGHTEIVTYLLSKGASVDTLANSDTSVLMFAIFSKNIKTIELLLKVPHLDINYADNNGHTALSMAVGYQHVEAVKLLLEYGADESINTVVNKEWSPLLIAADKDNGLIGRLFAQYGANLNFKIPGDKLSALEWAQQWGSTSFLFSFLSPQQNLEELTSLNTEFDYKQWHASLPHGKLENFRDMDFADLLSALTKEGILIIAVEDNEANPALTLYVNNDLYNQLPESLRLPSDETVGRHLSVGYETLLVDEADNNPFDKPVFLLRSRANKQAVIHEYIHHSLNMIGTNGLGYIEKDGKKITAEAPMNTELFLCQKTFNELRQQDIHNPIVDENCTLALLQLLQLDIHKEFMESSEEIFIYKYVYDLFKNSEQMTDHLAYNSQIMILDHVSQLWSSIGSLRRKLLELQEVIRDQKKISISADFPERLRSFTENMQYNFNIWFEEFHYKEINALAAEAGKQLKERRKK
ncbi:MAG: ankyrin repeat domain-containing protein [Deltaproteobacteria bacterium]|nr:ankyrin repeat domain-containing protein [Deltaproteobacteria bacterium]